LYDLNDYDNQKKTRPLFTTGLYHRFIVISYLLRTLPGLLSERLLRVLLLLPDSLVRDLLLVLTRALPDRSLLRLL
jgi:hypothetical protein